MSSRHTLSIVASQGQLGVRHLASTHRRLVNDQLVQGNQSSIDTQRMQNKPMFPQASQQAWLRIWIQWSSGYRLHVLRCPPSEVGTGLTIPIDSFPLSFA